MIHEFDVGSLRREFENDRMPSFAPGEPIRSMRLSLTIMEDMTTLVPPSRGRQGKASVSISTRPSIL